MEFQRLTYLFLLLIFTVIPIIIGRKNLVSFSGKLKFIFPGIAFGTLIFSIWDIRFTQLGIWTFNPDYIVGLEIFTLPVEEYLFFVIVPLSGVFIYEFLKVKLSRFEKPNLFLSVSLILLIFLGITAFLSREKLYPFFTFFLLTIYFGYTIFRNKFKTHYTKFYLTYFIMVVPYLLFSGLLNTIPVKSYDLLHQLNISFFYSPIENLGYLFLLLLMNIAIFENLQTRKIF
jgi:lycopene cyclase domain-containing protein